jgi:hypothetical protein
MNIKLVAILLAVVFAAYTFSKKYKIVRREEKKPIVAKKAPAPEPVPEESDTEEEKES